MLANYSHSVAARTDVSTRAETNGEGLGDRVMDRLRHLVCGLHGHDALLQFDNGRMFLKCVSCGHETPGWEVNDVPPTVTVRGDAERHALPRPHLITERRVA